MRPRRQRTGNREQRSEGRSLKTEIRSKRVEARCKKLEVRRHIFVIWGIMGWRVGESYYIPVRCL